MLSTKSVRLIVIVTSPAVVEGAIVKAWKYSGPLFGLLVFRDCKIIAVSAPPVKEPPEEVVILMIGGSSKISETSILRVYSPRTNAVLLSGTPSSSVM